MPVFPHATPAERYLKQVNISHVTNKCWKTEPQHELLTMDCGVIWERFIKNDVLHVGGEDL